MAKHKVSAKAVAADIRSGMNDADLMAKYGLSPNGLSYVHQKLIEHHLVTHSQVSDIRSPQPTEQAANQPAPVEPAPASAEPTVDLQLAQAFAEDVRKGRHDYDLMIRFHLGREELQVLMDNVVRLGYLSAAEVESRRSEKVKQCPYCYTLVSASASECQKCGRALIVSPGASRMPRPRAKSQGGVETETSEDLLCAWEDYSNNRGTRGLFRAYFVTVWRCIASPTEFFSTLPVDTGYSAPAMFGSLSVTVPVVILAVIVALAGGWFSKDGIGALVIFAGLVCLVGFVAAGLGLYIGSCLVHGCLTLLGGNERPLQTTFRVVSYAQAASLFGSIPVIGGLVGNIYGVYLTGIGLRETHNTSSGKAFGAVIPPVVCLCVAAFIGLMTVVVPSQSPGWKQALPVKHLTTMPSSSGTEFRSDAGRFFIAMPVPLKEARKTISTKYGKADMFVFSARRGPVEYLLAYADPPSIAGIFAYVGRLSGTYASGKILDETRDRLVLQLGSTLIDETNIMLDNNPGREFAMELPKKFGNDMRMRLRLFLVKGRVYQITAVAPKDLLDGAELNDFFDSFGLLTQ